MVADIESLFWGLRQNNNLKTIANLEKYTIYGFDTSRHKFPDFDFSLTHLFTDTDCKIFAN
jgi:hypothetical protein